MMNMISEHPFISFHVISYIISMMILFGDAYLQTKLNKDITYTLGDAAPFLIVPAIIPGLGIFFAFITLVSLCQYYFADIVILGRKPRD